RHTRWPRDWSSDVCSSDLTVLLEAHQDTVPTDHMTVEPFAARVENGRLYGRGACDIKGGMASMLAAFARVAREKPRGAANVVMEIGRASCRGRGWIRVGAG